MDPVLIKTLWRKYHVPVPVLKSNHVHADSAIPALSVPPPPPPSSTRKVGLDRQCNDNVNMAARSHKHRCRGKAVSIKQC